MINGSLARHILPEELSIQQSHTVGPQMEFTDGPLFLDPGLDLDAMDFDINTAGVDDQAFRFSVTELPSTILGMMMCPQVTLSRICPSIADTLSIPVIPHFSSLRQHFAVLLTGRTHLCLPSITRQVGVRFSKISTQLTLSQYRSLHLHP